MTSVVDDFALVETDTTSFGLQIGVEWAQLDGRVVAERSEDRLSTRDKADGYAPVVGACVSTSTADQKRCFTVPGQ